MESVARTCIDEPAAAFYIRRAQTLLNRILPAVKAPRGRGVKWFARPIPTPPPMATTGPIIRPAQKTQLLRRGMTVASFTARHIRLMLVIESAIDQAVDDMA